MAHRTRVGSLHLAYKRSAMPSRRYVPALALCVFLLLPVCCSFEQTSQPAVTSMLAHNTTHARASPLPFNTRRLDDLVDATLLPDFWNSDRWIDARIKTNGETPEQLVKVTDRRHRFPVFATVCSLAFLLTIIAIIVVCTH